MPLGLLFTGFITALVVKNKRTKYIAFRVSFFLLLLFTNPFLGNEIMRLWEYKPLSFQEIKKPYELAIVLTGVSDNLKMPRDRVYFHKGADRVTHTVQLYKKGLVRKILISGGHGAFKNFSTSEAENLKNAFLLMGVPASDLLTETESKNTHQSAVNCRKIVEGKYHDIVLISSSFHLKRARACFKKADIPVDIFPVDFYSSERKLTPEAWIPNQGALNNWSVVFHEILGIMAYKIMGYA
ncbi:MAG: YdcF family protein [Cyclobacteriaceae bacterium]|nr:YdcF family protein [Cyclobacteriaceae bacterium]